MKVLALGACVALLAATAALADDAADPMASTYGNTLVVIDGKGLESHTNYTADHKFAGVAPAYSYHYQGTWDVTDGKLCRTFDPVPPGITNPDCAPVETHAVGDKWALPDGGSATLIAGIAPETPMPQEAPAAAAPAAPATPATTP